MKDRDLFGGLIRLHILHHACHEPVFGLGIMEELGRHGYKLGPGTLYPILHGMEKTGYLVSSNERVAGRNRRVYTATDSGRSTLQIGKDRVRELLRELIEEDGS
jgi:DNA-binding PadR family transcriptional regulator